MIERSNFIKNEVDSDNRYLCYHLNTSIKIFNHVITDKDLDDVYIYVAYDIQLLSIICQVIHYIDWFRDCETVLKPYYETQLSEKVHDSWFNEINVYRVDLTFDNEYEYGATIYCGDTIIGDHSLEIEFEKYDIVEIRLNG